MIVTPRLLLGPSNDNRFYKKQAEWLNDPEVMRYSEQRHKRHTFDTQRAYVESFEWPNVFQLIMSDGGLIGTITAHVDSNNNVADVGILIGERTKWGRGYGMEAWKGFCDSLFSRGIRKIEAGCMAHNRGMMNICNRYGMVEEGRRRNHFILNGKPDDMVLFGKLA